MINWIQEQIKETFAMFLNMSMESLLQPGQRTDRPTYENFAWTYNACTHMRPRQGKAARKQSFTDKLRTHDEKNNSSIVNLQKIVGAK